MRVIRLQAENFKRLTAIDITPTGDVVTITGKNAQGKSSILDALWAVLEGAAALQREPIRQGAERALLRVELGVNGVVKYIATRTIAKKAEGGFTTSVKVANPEGAIFPSPQKLLDDLIGDLSFDPLEFARGTSREQFEALSTFAPGVDFEAIANLNRGAYDKRTEANRKAREARAAASIMNIPSPIPEKLDDVALVEQLGKATQRANEISAHTAGRQSIERDIDRELRALRDAQQELTDLEERVADVKHRIERTLEAQAALQRRLDDYPLPPLPIDTAEVAEQLRKAQTHNKAVSDILAGAEKRASLVRLAESYEAESAEHTAQIDARLQARAEAIAAAKLPVEGLGFGDGEVLLNGVPFNQGSSAEQLRTSVAIAAAMNPELRVIHIRDGSLLDVDSMAWLAKYAAENDLQVWCEVVGTDPTIGVLIEDGHVKVAEAAA